MNKWIVKLSAALLCIMMILSLLPPKTASADEGYTYNYDWWGDVQYSPDAYEVVGVFTAKDLGLDLDFNSPSGLYIFNNRIYICDTGNNRIVEMERTSIDGFSLVRIIDSFKGDIEITTFSGPTDIAVMNGYLFICDKNNGRILKLDQELNFVMEITKPTDETFDQSLDFLPNKLTVDTAGRIYCVATNVNKGLIKFEADGKFAGFLGATPVTFNWTDYVWKRLATQKQREQMESFVPTEYDNLYMDYEGFIYVCTTNISIANLDSGRGNAIRRLNMMGNDILIRNGNHYIIGDIYFDEGGGYTGPSLLTDITVFDNDVYVAIDKVRGRIFAYDDQGRMLYAFGGPGNLDGYFKSPIAIDHMDRDLFVLDLRDRSITVFTPTYYGKLIFSAIEQFESGEYEASGKTWEEVIKLNGNYDLAYIGIGRSLLGQKKYREAMDYFKLKWDDDNYSMAFKQYRKEWVEKNIALVLFVVFALLCVPLIIGRILKIKHILDTSDIF
jgi:hypothetical protein